MYVRSNKLTRNILSTFNKCCCPLLWLEIIHLMWIFKRELNANKMIRVYLLCYFKIINKNNHTRIFALIQKTKFNRSGILIFGNERSFFYSFKLLFFFREWKRMVLIQFISAFREIFHDTWCNIFDAKRAKRWRHDGVKAIYKSLNSQRSLSVSRTHIPFAS